MLNQLHNVITFQCCDCCLFPLSIMAKISLLRPLMKRGSKRLVTLKATMKVFKTRKKFSTLCICLSLYLLWIDRKPDRGLIPLYNILYNSANRMFSSAFLKQKTIQIQDNMLPFCSPDRFITQNLWHSNRLHRDVWIVGNICPHNGPMPGSKAGEGLIFLPSVCLSMIRIIGVERSGNATNVKQYIPRISAAFVHNGALC